MIMDTIGLSINNYISFINRESKIHIPQTHPLKVMGISLFKVEVCQIDEIFAQVEKPIILDNRDICGIPLTEEWLIKSDISINFRETSYRGKYYIFVISGILFYFFTDTNTIEMKESHMIYKYLHTFQNLYFTLTQTRLIIK